MYKNIILILIFTVSLFANDNSFDSQTISIENNNYKIVNFKKRVVDIRLSNSEHLSIVFLNNKTKPFSKIKIFAKKIGSTNAIITFDDKSTSKIHFNITLDIRNIKALIKEIAKDVVISQVNGTIILKGKVVNNKIKDKILLILTQSVPAIKVINLLKVEEPDKMVRLKLYVTEINNKEGETIKNNWSLGGFNDGTTSIDMTANMLSAVTLSGGLALNANILGSKFNTGLTLNYLKSNGVANILDETTLVTLENKSSNFLAGGNLLIETASTSADGQPISAIEKIPYGLELNIKVNEIINDSYVKLEIDTKSSTLDNSNKINNIPATEEKSIKTYVVVGDKSTIVLGGLIKNTNSKDWEKVPLLGDIPIIGKLFQSRDFQDGKSELVFFITPTIVDSANNNQETKYKVMKKNIIVDKKEVEDTKTTVIKVKHNKKQLTNQELHNKRIREMFGI